MCLTLFVFLTIADINVTISAQFNNVQHYFYILNVNEIIESSGLCLFYVFTKHTFDYEDKNQYELNITATDSDGWSSVATVTVEVKSVNEYSPHFTLGGM